LKSPIKLLQLEGTVDGAGLSHFLALAIHSQSRVLDFVCKVFVCAVNEKKGEKKI
jgi:hypothetical protein